MMQMARVPTRASMINKKTIRGDRIVCTAVRPQRQGKLDAMTSVAIGFVASWSMASMALADVTVKLGDDSGSLVFEPSNISISKGEKVTFVNNKGFPHNVVFDEDAVPEGVDADKISHEDYLNAPGESVSNVLDVPGVYEGYCEPHQGAGMVFKITVS